MRSDLVERNTSACADLRARFRDPAQKLRIVFQTVIEPIVFRREADEHAGGSPVPRDHNLLFRGQTKVLRKIILHCGQRRRAGLASPRRRASSAPPLC